MLAIVHFERPMAVRMGGQMVKHRECPGSPFGECSGSVRGVFNEVRARTPGNEALALSNDSARGWRRDVELGGPGQLDRIEVELSESPLLLPMIPTSALLEPVFLIWLKQVMR